MGDIMRLIARAAEKISDEQANALLKLGVWIKPGPPRYGLRIIYFNRKSKDADEIQAILDDRMPCPTITSIQYSDEERERAVAFHLGSKPIIGYLTKDAPDRCEVCRTPVRQCDGYRVELELRSPKNRHVLSTTYDRLDVFFTTRGLVDLLAERGVAPPEIAEVEYAKSARRGKEFGLVRVCPQRIEPGLERDLVRSSGFHDVYHPSCGHHTYEFNFRAPFLASSSGWSELSGFRHFDAAGAIPGNLDPYRLVLVDAVLGNLLRSIAVSGCNLEPVFHREVFVPEFDETPLGAIEGWKPDY